MKKTVALLPLMILLVGCSSNLDSGESGKDLANATVPGEETTLEDFSLTLEDGVQSTQVPKESAEAPEPEYPELVEIDSPDITVPLDPDTTNYYLFEDNFNNTSITAFTTKSYPAIEGIANDPNSSGFLEEWLEHFTTLYEGQDTTGEVEHGFLTWEDGTRGAYVSYEFAVPEIPSDTLPVEGQAVGEVETHPTFFTEFVLIKDEKMLSGTSTAEQLGFPAYLQSLEF